MKNNSRKARTHRYIDYAILFSLLLSASLMAQTADQHSGSGTADAGYTVYTDEESFLAALSEKTTVDFDTYPDGTTIPTGYTHTGQFTGFAFSGEEFAVLGVEFGSPVGATLSTVSTIDASPFDLFVSPPNSLTPGAPPSVGSEGIEDDDNNDSLHIVFTSPVIGGYTGAGLIFIDNGSSSPTESITFFDQNGDAIAILELPGYFIGITSDVPIGTIAIAEDADDSDDVSYDNLTFGTAEGSEQSVSESGLIPETFALHANYPNPFNSVTTLKYDLAEKADVTLTIYDLLGRRVRTLVQDVEEAGFRSVVWDGTNDLGEQVSAGVYLYHIHAGDFIQTRKMVLVK